MSPLFPLVVFVPELLANLFWKKAVLSEESSSSSTALSEATLASREDISLRQPLPASPLRKMTTRKLPSHLKAGMESLSGIALDKERVRRVQMIWRRSCRNGRRSGR
jgi:hypothetical protein